ncbi:MAG: glycosyltransferase [Candidatus Scalinduaceae bacterium]
MKKALIIAYAFPPLQVSGSQRPYRLAKYFPKFGWEPIVLTVKHPGISPEGIKVIKTDYKDVKGSFKSKFGFKPQKVLHEQLDIAISKKYNDLTWKSKIIRLLKEIIAFPDSKIGWYKFAFKSASKFLLKEKIDVIISTSPPVTTHLIARKLSKKYKIPWLADLRDPWAQLYADNKLGLIKYFDKRLATKTLNDADILVTVTKPQADVLKALFKDKKVFCITNGYDTDDFPEKSLKLTDKFTITHTGKFCKGERDPSLLFGVVTNLIKKNRIKKDLIEIKFYGKKEDWLLEEINKYNLEGVVDLCGLIPRQKVLERQRESQLLLLLRLNNEKEKGDCPAKLFEYFGARRPIVATGGYGGIIKDFLEETNAGKFAENSDMLENIILEHYQEFIQFGEVKYYCNDNIENYTYNSITKKYSEILKMFLLN